jgi:chromosome segregation ATPase
MYVIQTALESEKDLFDVNIDSSSAAWDFELLDGDNNQSTSSSDKSLTDTRLIQLLSATINKFEAFDEQKRNTALSSIITSNWVLRNEVNDIREKLVRSSQQTDDLRSALERTTGYLTTTRDDMRKFITRIKLTEQKLNAANATHSLDQEEISEVRAQLKALEARQTEGQFQTQMLSPTSYRVSDQMIADLEQENCDLKKTLSDERAAIGGTCHSRSPSKSAQNTYILQSEIDSLSAKNLSLVSELASLKTQHSALQTTLDTANKEVARQADGRFLMAEELSAATERSDNLQRENRDLLDSLEEAHVRCQVLEEKRRDRRSVDISI